MTYRKEIPKLNIDNFVIWKGFMRLNVKTISDLGCVYLDIEYKNPTETLL